MTASDIPAALLALPPLAVAAGVDLYLTLLLIGAAPTLGLWDLPLPGALGDLDSPSVLITVGLFYLAELVAERFPPSAIVWNAFHAIIRPVSGALLALLLLDGEPLALVVGGAVLAGLLSSMAHGIRSGWAVLRWLGAGSAPPTRLLSLAEDVGVIGLVSLTLDAPAWALGLTVVVLAVVTPSTRSLLRAFDYAIRLIAGRVFVTLRQRRWNGPDELPEWVAAALENDDVLAPGGALRGSPVGAWRLPGAPRFVVGWVVVRGGPPVFVYRKRRIVPGRRPPERVDLGDLEASQVYEADLFRRLDLQGGGTRPFLLFGLGGPSVESLRAEFDFATVR
jgi:hypothetical protein